MAYKSEINALRKQIEKLEAAAKREESIRDVLKDVNKKFRALLKNAGVTLDEFVASQQRSFANSLAKLEGKAAPKRSVKKAVKKKGRRKTTRRASSIKIPAGSYSNIPPDNKKVYKVKEKGPRPKAVKAHAEALGIDKFLKECRTGN